jgi:hypothetical protein
MSVKERMCGLKEEREKAEGRRGGPAFYVEPR